MTVAELGRDAARRVRRADGRRAPPARPRPRATALHESARSSLIAKDEEITAGALAKRAELSPGAMTALLDQLERDGVIAPPPLETDRRQVIVSLTEAGRESVAAKRAACGSATGTRASPPTPRRSCSPRPRSCARSPACSTASARTRRWGYPERANGVLSP